MIHFNKNVWCINGKEITNGNDQVIKIITNKEKGYYEWKHKSGKFHRPIQVISLKMKKMVIMQLVLP